MMAFSTRQQFLETPPRPIAPPTPGIPTHIEDLMTYVSKAYPNLDILPDDLQPADEPSALSLSTRQLLYAVLERALMDLSGKCSEGGQTWKHSAHYVVDAAEWLSDLDSTEPWSFWWVCAHLNLDPGRVQEAIHRSALAYTQTREDA